MNKTNLIEKLQKQSNDIHLACDEDIAKDISETMQDAIIAITNSMNELSGSESIFGFCGWLTSRKEKTIMSSFDDCSCIADLIKEFIETNDLIDVRQNWTDNLIHPNDDK